MNSHRVYRQWLIWYVSGELPVNQARALRHHLDSCPVCARWFEEQLELWRMLSEWRLPEVTVASNRELEWRLELERSRGSSHAVAYGAAEWAPWRLVVAAAVTCALALVLSLPNRPGVATRSEPGTLVELERIEQVLEDLEMLQQLDLGLDEPGAGPQVSTVGTGV